MFERLLQKIHTVGNPKVLLAGDFMVDSYLYGTTGRICQEAPVPVLNAVNRQYRPGGAGSVGANLAVLGASVSCLGIRGTDDLGTQLQGLLTAAGAVDTTGLIACADRATTGKTRVIGLSQNRQRQQLMRIDQEDASPISPEISEQLLSMAAAQMAHCDVVCLQDHNKGVLHDTFCRDLIALAREANKPVVLDAAPITDYTRYSGAWLIKPNRTELSLAAGCEVTDDESALFEAAGRLCREHSIENIAVTLDQKGLYLYQSRQATGGEPSGTLIPTRQRSVYDGTGAGDMVVAIFTLLAGADPDCRHDLTDAAALANVAGGLEVERFGCVPVTRDEICVELSRQRRTQAGKLRSTEDLLTELQWHRSQKLRIVFTNGCFDILHPGHIKLLSQARQCGDILVVAINSDASVRALKGENRPILSQADRAELLSALEPVDYVVIFDADTPIDLIKRIGPDVLVKGSDWTGAVVGQEYVESIGGVVQVIPLSPGRSTTNIIDTVLARHAADGRHQQQEP